MNPVDESLLIVGNEADESSRLLVVQQHQDFDVALSVVAEVNAAREPGFHHVVQRLQRRLVVFRELKLHRPRFGDERAERGEKLIYGRGGRGGMVHGK